MVNFKILLSRIYQLYFIIKLFYYFSINFLNFVFIIYYVFITGLFSSQSKTAVIPEIVLIITVKNQKCLYELKINSACFKGIPALESYFNIFKECTFNTMFEPREPSELTSSSDFWHGNAEPGYPDLLTNWGPSWTTDDDFFDQLSCTKNVPRLLLPAGVKLFIITKSMDNNYVWVVDSLSLKVPVGVINNKWLLDLQGQGLFFEKFCLISKGRRVADSVIIDIVSFEEFKLRLSRLMFIKIIRSPANSKIFIKFFLFVGGCSIVTSVIFYIITNW